MQLLLVLPFVMAAVPFAAADFHYVLLTSHVVAFGGNQTYGVIVSAAEGENAQAGCLLKFPRD